MPSARLALLAASAAALLAPASLDAALACACCANMGQRNIGTVPLDDYKRSEIDRLRFATTAILFVPGETDERDIKGITKPSLGYELNAAWHSDRLVFAFRASEGQSGTLSLARPRMISLFEVDPRDVPGTVLYKEWTLTARAAGSGVFSVGLGPGQTLSLILHGRGLNCTSIDEFKHWTLVMRGPKANYSLLGDLEQPSPLPD